MRKVACILWIVAILLLIISFWEGKAHVRVLTIILGMLGILAWEWNGQKYPNKQ